MSSKQDEQLGSKSSTYRLTKDILFKLIIKAGHRCFRCGGILNRNDFSIDHKTPWLDKPNAIELFFDLENIAFSHRKCNYKAARRPNKKFSSKKEANAAYHKTRLRPYNQERRRAQYLRTGT